MSSGRVSLVFVRRFALGLFALVFLVPRSALGQATAPPLPLGNVNLKATVTGSVTFTFTAAQTQITSIAVTTQGATGLDFALGTAGTNACAVNGVYSAGATCHVAINFSPLAPGMRQGAATITTASGNVLSGFVFGVGVGALLENNSTTAYSNLTSPTGSFSPTDVAVDASNNVYVLDNQGSRVLRYLADGSAPTTVFTVSSPLFGIAVDGSGNLVLADSANKRIIQGVIATGGTNVLYSGFTGTPGSLAFDASGNLYVVETADIIKIAPSGTRTTIAATSPTALTVSPAGDLYWTSSSAPSIVNELVHGTSTPITGGTIPGGNVGQCLALDPAGNLFVTATSGNIYEFTGGTVNSSFQVFSSALLGIASAPNGNLYIADSGSILIKFTRTVGNSFTATGATAVASTSSQEFTTTYFNNGNAPMTLASYGASNAAAGPSTTCSLTTPLAINASCVQSIEFAPTQHGSPLTGSLTLTGNVTPPALTVTGYVTGDAVKLGFGTPPTTTVTAGGNAGTVTVQVQDNGGIPVSSATNTISLAVINSGGYSQNYSAPAVNGTATFNLSGATLTMAGTYTYSATSSGLAPASTIEAVVAAAATNITVTPASLTAYAGGVADAITVKAFDPYGNTVTGNTDTIALSSTDPAATLPAPFALAAGTATQSVTFNTAGSQTVTATDTTNPAIPAATSVAITVKNVPSYLVTTGTDDASGIAANCPNQADGGAASNTCSLRDAFAAVTALSNSGTGTYVPTINFATSLYGQTITMTAISTVNGNVALIGPGAGANAITLSGNNAVIFLLQAASAPITNISGLTFSNFRGAQAPVLIGSSGGTFTLTNDTFSNNYASGGNNGGALSINGAITVTGCTFSGNTSTASGGAFTTTQTSLTISNSLFSSNTAASGGAISTSGSGAISIVNTAFLSNKANGGNGGALFSNVSTAPLTITNDTFNNNTATISGGALYTGGLLTISGSSFSANQTGSTTNSLGGAIYNFTASIGSITNTNFIGNKVVTTGTTASGGALYAARMNLTNVLFSGNSVSSASTANGGGAYYNGNYPSTFTGVTFTGNTTGGGASAQNGGAFYGSSSQLTLYNTTITGNSAKTSGGYFRIGGSSNLYNSVISGNTATGFPDMNTAPTIYSSSYFNVATPCSANCTPLLSALGSYGGGTVGATGYTTPVMTMLPLPGSPLLAAGSLSYVGAPGTLSGGATTDARGTGYPRTTFHNSSNHVDIGAAEANYSLSFVQQPTTIQPGSTVMPAPTVQLLESGVVGGDGVGNDQGSYAGGVLAITATPDAASTASVTTTAGGLETLNESFTGFTPSETLTVSAQSGATTPVTVASATSNAFGIGMTKTINFTQPASPAPAGSTATLVATASNSDPVTFSVTAGSGTASISGNIITFLTPGTVTVAADSAATSTTLAAPTVSYSITIVGMPYVFVVGSGSAASLDVHGVVSSTAVAGGGIGAAVDAGGYVWSINSNGTSLSTFTPTGALGTSYSPTGITGASALGIDGNSNVIVPNGNGTISTVSNTGAALHTTSGSTTVAPSGVTIDSSGNIWVSNATTNTLDEIIGGAAPASPLATAVQNSTTGVKP